MTNQPRGNDAATPVRQAPPRVLKGDFSFVGSGLRNINKFKQLKSQSSGMAVAQAAGALTITTGTTANQEVIIRSNTAFYGGITFKAAIQLSQRIANNNFFVELADLVGEDLAYVNTSAVSVDVTIPNTTLTSENIGQSMYLGGFMNPTGTVIPGRYAISAVNGNVITFTVAGWGGASATGTLTAFGKSFIRVLYDGTIATQAKFDAAQFGWASGDTTTTINTTAAPGHIFQVQTDCNYVTFSDALTASSASPSYTSRASRTLMVPDENLHLYLFIRALNGTTNPATTTTFTVLEAYVEQHANNKVFIAGTQDKGSSFIPATVISTTSTAKAEDVPHVSGDIGTMALGVRYESVAAALTDTAGDYSPIQVDSLGKTIVVPHAPSVNQKQAALAAKVDTADSVLFTAGAAGVKTNVAWITLVNTSAIGTAVVIKDNATVIWTGYAPANGSNHYQFDTPLKGTAATVMNVACLTTATNTIVTAGGFNAI